MMSLLEWYLDPPSSHQLKNVVKVEPPLTKLFGFAHGVYQMLQTGRGGDGRQRGPGQNIHA